MYPFLTKYEAWVTYYFDPKDKITHLNATQSAIRAYGYNPVTQYNLASVVGCRNLRKYKAHARIELERQGMGFNFLIMLGFVKVMQGSFDDWVKFMRFLGYWEDYRVDIGLKPY